jgi:lysophospholipase L1-like esterase
VHLLPTRPAFMLVLLAAAPLAAAEPNDAFFFKKGDRVVFLGDSITEQYGYSSAIELYLTTRFPDWNLTFLNAGIGGDTATGGAKRFASHVLAEKPTAVTIDFGMNDGGYGEFKQDRFDAYVKNTEAMLQAAKEAGVRVAVISPNAVEVRSKPGLKTYLDTQKQFYAPLKDLAAKYDDAFVDQYAVTREVLDKIAADNADVKPFPDGVHTSPAGALLMVHTILVGLKAPAVVSDVQIDVTAKKPDLMTRCKIDDLSISPDHAYFDRTDEALPLPVQKDWRPLLPYVDQLKDLNYYGLKVSGLNEGKYDLTIDGTKVGTYTSADLAASVNLGNLESGPLFERSNLVYQAINVKNNELVHPRFRKVVMFTPSKGEEGKREEKLKQMMDEIASDQEGIYKLAQPKTLRFELKAAK